MHLCRPTFLGWIIQPPFWPFLRLVVCALLCCSLTGAAAEERTLALVKPDGMRGNHSHAIKGIIRGAGFSIVVEDVVHLQEITARKFYEEHSERDFFPELIAFMTSGPVLAMMLERSDAVREWRALMGPTDSRKARLEHPDSIRAKFGIDGQSNCVHGSDSLQAAAREIALIFEDYRAAKPSTHDEL